MERAVLEQYHKKYRSDLFEAVLPFWLDNGWDKAYGGINTCLDREGKLFSEEKSVWMQGRGAWTAARICRAFGVDGGLSAMAQSALAFTKEKCTDPADGRLYFIVGQDGTPVRKRRYVFSEYFYIMANAEYYGLTREQHYLQEARKYHAMVTAIWKNPEDDPFKITPKFLPTAPAMRGLCGDMMLMLVTRTLRVNDPENTEVYLAQERALFHGILQYQFVEELGTLLEAVGPQGQYLSHLSAGRVVNPGHCLECVWCLLQEARELGEMGALGRIEQIYRGAYEYGWDKEYGGLLYLVDTAGFAPQAYEHDMKLWWVHTEAILAAIKLYRATGKQCYWDDFTRLTNYAFSHFRDGAFGEWVGYLRRDGVPTQPVCKGNLFKGPFHVPRMYCEVTVELEALLAEESGGEKR